MAGVTGLEPATSGVTGRRSNQLSYTPAARSADRAGSARGVVYCGPSALSRNPGFSRLPTRSGGALVGGDGIEPPTSCV